MNVFKFAVSRLGQRVSEVYFRARHALHIFSKRFFTLTVFGHVDLDPGFGLDEKKAIDRGNCAPDGRFYSKYQTVDWPDLPVSIKQAIKNYDSVLRMFLGDGYLINEGRIWRNYSIPEAYRNTELFSQHWHYDKVVDFRNIQLFVLLGDVTLDDGPFEYVANPDESNILPSVLDRNNQDLNVITKKLTGKRGDTCLFSTGSTPHRAGIPADGRQRDIFSIAFFPAYTKIGHSSTELLAQPH
jgi:hypothetical protein